MAKKKKTKKGHEDKEVMDGLKMPFAQAMSFLVKQPDNKEEDQPKKPK
jgi:hypothetical protein